MNANEIAFVRCDVAKESDVAATVAEAVKRFGRLDIAYLNAGVGGAFGPIAETSVEDWDYTFAVLVRSVFLECNAGYRTDGPEHLRPVGETDGSGTEWTVIRLGEHPDRDSAVTEAARVRSELHLKPELKAIR